MITAVCINWKRPKNIDKIVSALYDNKNITEIIIWNCNLKCDLSHLYNDKVRIVNGPDYGLISRWHASAMAKNDAIFMQDDDLIASNEDINNYYQKWLLEPNIIHGLEGRYPKDGKYSGLIYGSYSEIEIVLTRAMMFDKKYAKLFFETKKSGWLSETIETNGEDIYFSYLVLNISNKLNKVHDLINPVTELPTPYAISKRKNHIATRTKILNECVNLFHVKIQDRIVGKFNLKFYIISNLNKYLPFLRDK